MTERAPFYFHRDLPLFREAVTFTAAQTTFIPRLIEKDYFCSLVLQYLSEAVPEMFFKGGTCLAKIHLGFYRLSEDLDFGIAMPVDASRTTRRRRVSQVKKAVEMIGDHLDGLRVIAPLAGANDSSQYAAVVGYPSRLSTGEESVSVEVSLREPLLKGTVRGSTSTLLLDPISGAPLAPSFLVSCMSHDEAMAEKLRAALTRREAAIRDFYDIDHAVSRLGLDVRHAGVVGLLRRKLTVPGNAPTNISRSRLESLRAQLESRLRPVLRERDFVEFDLDRAFAIVTEVAAAVA